ncbi:succinyl-diaminopimelate desuccinylase [Corynebacterium terpenotabidum]|uniref:Succinyl-diaminopimelate desuccinylase n=1 Tax=Corynebacterium terpenotabidum Y-11 TaxID=1200352 RepID=S4XDE1_9CORY|nr:succinyl-diaminopimelate desuccinylase [Corynebacterium terpenotabidum]AGP31167.1 succinyl-diaminopimelate desuccinylase [Corynebacterium terpenotabidum Y-11]
MTAQKPVPRLDLTAGPVELTAALVDIPSTSHEEDTIADALERAFTAVALPGVTVDRHGNTLVVRTHRGLPTRVVLAGHIDTVPPADNLPSRRAPDATGADSIHGLGSVDMKSGDAVYIHAFVTLATSADLVHDLTLVLYDGEEVASRYNGLRMVSEAHPDWLAGDVALLGEPSGAVIEAGCQGTLRVRVTAHGTRAHSARSWLGDNAAHRLSPVIARVAAYHPRDVDIDGCVYREGLNVVHLESGVATNTVPDEAWMFVNFRFAPDRSADAALAHTLEVLGVGTPEDPAEGFTLEIDDLSPAALPGLHQPAAAALVAATGGNVRAKYGWTDVSRFAALGIPAVNFGPGDPGLCHTPQENCPVEMITTVSDQLLRYLTTPA